MSSAERTADPAGVRIVAVLRGCIRLKTVPAALLADIAGHCSVITVAVGQTVFRVGEQGRAMYVVATGRIASRVRSGSGQVLDVGFAGPGELFGYFEAFDGGQRDSDAVALETSVLVRVPHPHGRRLLSSGTEPLIGVVADLLQIVRTQNRDAIERHAHPVPMRLAALLLDLADGAGRVTLHGPQTLLAHRIGTTRQSLSRSLHRMVTDGLIRVEGGGRQIVILDRARLRAQAQPGG